MNELDNYDLSDLNNAVDEFYKEITAETTPVNNPKAYILGGQAGAGKSHLHRMIVRNEPNTFDEITLYDRQENELYRMTDTPDISPYWIVDERLNTTEFDENKELDLTQEQSRGR